MTVTESGHPQLLGILQELRQLRLSVCLTDISHSSFVEFQVWDIPGQIDFFDPAFDSDIMFGRCGALIFVVDAQVTTYMLYCVLC